MRVNAIAIPAECKQLDVLVQNRLPLCTSFKTFSHLNLNHFSFQHFILSCYQDSAYRIVVT